MHQHEEHDPFAGLEEWGRDTERRVRRERNQRHLRPLMLLVAAAAVVAVLLAVAVPALRSKLSASSGGTGTAYPTQSVPGGVSATSSAGALPSGPFADTPAAAYPKGRAGITLPKATAVKGFTAAQVEAALTKVRAALIAGRLETSMLIGHDPAPLLGLLAENQRATIGKWFTSARFDTVATWIDPAVRLDLAEQPRVSGRVTYASVLVDDIQTLRVTTNFVWVYAFSGADHPLAVAHDENHWEFPSTKRLRAGDHGMWIGTTRAYTAWVDCAAGAKGLLAPTRRDAAPVPGPRSSEDEKAYLRPDHSLTITNDCPPRA